MKVTVTGGTGTLGHASARMLLKTGHQVRVFVRSPDKFAQLCKDDRVEVVQVDLLDRSALAVLLEDTDAVIHCANFPPHRFNLSFDAARYLLEGLAPGAQLIYPTNVWAYGPPQDDRVGPDHPKASPARIGGLRGDLEKAILAHGGIVIHLPAAYGPRVTGGWVGAAFEGAFAGRKIRQPGSLDRRLELIYIEDAARALIAPLGRLTMRGREYTAPGYSPISLRELASLIESATGQSVQLRSRAIGAWRARALLSTKRRPIRDLAYLFECSTLLDGALIRKELGWSPEIDYEEGVRRTVDWLGDRGRESV